MPKGRLRGPVLYESAVRPSPLQRKGPPRSGGAPLALILGLLGTKPYKFIGLGALDVTKPYKFIGFGAMDVTKPYKFIGFGAMDVTKPYKFIGFGATTGNSALPRDRRWVGVSF